MNYNNECNFPFAATAKGINISSGYRCPELNKAVGGSSTSAHCHGYKHPDGKRQRGQYLSMIHGKYYPMTD